MKTVQEVRLIRQIAKFLRKHGATQCPPCLGIPHTSCTVVPKRRREY